jgi:hypothetical protein
LVQQQREGAEQGQRGQHVAAAADDAGSDLAAGGADFGIGMAAGAGARVEVQAEPPAQPQPQRRQHGGGDERRLPQVRRAVEEARGVGRAGRQQPGSQAGGEQRRRQPGDGQPALRLGTRGCPAPEQQQGRPGQQQRPQAPAPGDAQAGQAAEVLDRVHAPQRQHGRQGQSAQATHQPLRRPVGLQRAVHLARCPQQHEAVQRHEEGGVNEQIGRGRRQPRLPAAPDRERGLQRVGVAPAQPVLDAEMGRQAQRLLQCEQHQRHEDRAGHQPAQHLDMALPAHRRTAQQLVEPVHAPPPVRHRSCGAL